MVQERRKLLIIDGYNVLRSGSRYCQITDPDYTDDAFNRARESLLNDVISYAGRERSAVIVFDGARNRFSTGDPEFIGGVRVIFSPAGQSADKVIERLAHDARERGVEALVVTSDASIQDAVFGGGVDRMSANDFCREVAQLHEETERDAQPRIARKSTVSERIAPDVRSKLEALRDAHSHNLKKL